MRVIFCLSIFYIAHFNKNSCVSIINKLFTRHQPQSYSKLKFVIMTFLGVCSNLCSQEMDPKLTDALFFSLRVSEAIYNCSQHEFIFCILLRSVFELHTLKISWIFRTEVCNHFHWKFWLQTMQPHTKIEFNKRFL